MAKQQRGLIEAVVISVSQLTFRGNERLGQAIHTFGIQMSREENFHQRTVGLILGKAARSNRQTYICGAKDTANEPC
jgi:hypothetical protein